MRRGWIGALGAAVPPGRVGGVGGDRGRLSVLVAVVVIGVTGVAGCTGSHPAPTSMSTSRSSVSSSVSSSPTGSPSTTTTPTTTPSIGIPAAAQAHTPDGAAAFVRYYLEQIDRAWRDADVTLLPSLCLPQSKDCADSQQTAVELAAKHQHYAGVTATWTSILPLVPGDSVVRIRAVGAALKVDIVDDMGRVVSTDPPLALRLQYDVEWTNKGWRIKAGMKEA